MSDKTQKSFEVARTERKISLAQERDSRVVLVRTNDTHRILDIVRGADRGVRLIRANLLIRYQPEEVLPLLQEYQEAIDRLNKTAIKICSLAGVPYRSPKGMEVGAAVGDGDGAKKDKLVDAHMQTAYTTVFGE